MLEKIKTWLDEMDIGYNEENDGISWRQKEEIKSGYTLIVEMKASSMAVELFGVLYDANDQAVSLPDDHPYFVDTLRWMLNDHFENRGVCWSRSDDASTSKGGIMLKLLIPAMAMEDKGDLLILIEAFFAKAADEFNALLEVMGESDA